MWKYAAIWLLGVGGEGLLWGASGTYEVLQEVEFAFSVPFSEADTKYAKEINSVLQEQARQLEITLLPFATLRQNGRGKKTVSYINEYIRFLEAGNSGFPTLWKELRRHQGISKYVAFTAATGGLAILADWLSTPFLIPYFRKIERERRESEAFPYEGLFLDLLNLQLSYEIENGALKSPGSVSAYVEKQKQREEGQVNAEKQEKREKLQRKDRLRNEYFF